MVPENWLADDQAPEMKILPAQRDDRPGILSDMLYREPQPPRGTGLSLFMEPHELATVEGLPDHVREGLGDYAGQDSRGAAKQPAGYVSTLDQVSLTPDRDLSGAVSSEPGPMPKPEADDKLERAAKGVDILGKAIDGWDVLNHGVGLRLGMEGAEMLGKYAGPAGAALVPIEHAAEAYAETSKGAPEFETWAGAGGKAAAILGGMGAGAMAGAWGGPLGIAAGSVIGGLAPELMLRNVSNQQVGRFIDRAFQTRR